MDTTNLKKQQSLGEHVLVPALLFLANVTLGIVTYLLHQLYLVSSTDNTTLLHAYDFVNERAWQAFADSTLIWTFVFTGLLVAQLFCVKLNHNKSRLLIIFISIMGMIMWM